MSYYGNLNTCGTECESEEMEIRSSDDKSGRDLLDTKSYQTLLNTVRIRSYRAAVVCLVLLCVLLLTAVIVLGVQKSTTLTEDLAKQRDQLNQEKKELWDSIREMDGWIYYQSKFYFVSSEKKIWTESRKYCIERGADLITINNKDEHDLVRRVFGEERVWTGLTNRNLEGTWKWVDGSNMTSEFWASGEPHGYSHENCVMSYKVGWADVQCNYVLRCICEKRIFKVIA